MRECPPLWAGGGGDGFGDRVVANRGFSWSEHTGTTTLHAVDLETMEVVGERDYRWGTFASAVALIADRPPSS